MSVNTFTASKRGGSGKPLLCVHGFVDTWRTWSSCSSRSSARSTCSRRRCRCDWADDDPLFAETHVSHFTALRRDARAAVAHVDAIVRTQERHRRATELITTRPAMRYRAELPNADWAEIDGVGHCPQLDVPVETAELIAGFATVQH